MLVRYSIFYKSGKITKTMETDSEDFKKMWNKISGAVRCAIVEAQDGRAWVFTRTCRNDRYCRNGWNVLNSGEGKSICDFHGVLIERRDAALKKALE